jgi:hypothetical protein
VHQLYNRMAPIGQMHARTLASSIDAMCQQACTHAAMAGALVAQGISPSEAFHAVMAGEGAGLTIAPQMQVAPAHISPLQAGMGPVAQWSQLGPAMQAARGISPWTVGPSMAGAWTGGTTL